MGAVAASGTVCGSEWLAMPFVCCGWSLGVSLIGSVPLATALDAAGRLEFDQEATARALAISRIVGDLGMAGGCWASATLLGQLSVQGVFAVQAGVMALATAA